MKKSILIIFLSIAFISGCSIVKTLTNVSRLKFKVDKIKDFNISGININNKSKITDLNITDAFTLTKAVSKGNLRADFVLNIEAKNPNDGTGGHKATDIKLKSFPFTLYIDDVETVSGDISEPITVPGVGENQIISLNIGLDLIQFFKDKGYKGLMNLALKLGGKNSSTSSIKIVAQPVISTFLGDIKYPDKLTIVDTKFN
ncbi:MAG: hypothetical protein JEY94_00290 [Melioribacteraceae bacterium]|nr:hypothetical protein [Melioribacteraceae bacterium]